MDAVLNDQKNELPSVELKKFKGSGCHLKTPDGKILIDAASGTFNLPLGYSDARMTNALTQQIAVCSHLSSIFTKPSVDVLMKLLYPHLPAYINRYWFRDITGSAAVECAVRMAQKATGKSEIISFFKAHHGQSIYTTHLSGNAFRIENFEQGIIPALKIPNPDCNECFYNANRDTCGLLCAKRIVDFIEYASTGKIACLIIEPVLGNGGNILFPHGYFKEIREICTNYEIKIICDEVQTGFGRTGSFFASSGIAKDLKPDAIVFAKGAGGIGIPCAGVLMTPEMDILESYEHSSTAGANPLAIIAMEQTIKIIENDSLLENVLQLEPMLRARLLQLEQRYLQVSNVRGVGFMFGFDLPSKDEVSHLISVAYEHGLILRGSRYGFGKTIKIRPPLIAKKQDLQEIFGKLNASLTHIYGKHNEGVINEVAEIF